VTVRGNDKRPIFKDDADRRIFLEVLGKAATLFRWRVHAYVLMRNHFHLLVETPEPTLSRGMRHVNGVYTQRVNRRHGRSGHLFQGRFKAILVEKEVHLLELSRYVVLNPVRAGLARTPAGWKWSSFRATAGREAGPSWLVVDGTLDLFGRNRPAAREAWKRFVAQGKGATYDPWSQVTRQVYLGGEAFRTEVATRLKGTSRAPGVPWAQLTPVPLRLGRAPAALQEVFGVSLETLRQKTRTMVAERRLLASVLRTEGLFSLREIGTLLGVGPEQAGLLARADETDGSGTTRRRLIRALSAK